MRENVFSILKPNNYDNFIDMFIFPRTELEGAGEFY